jgi:hypothetical protein
MLLKILAICCFAALTLFSKANAELCKDFMLLDGSEEVASYGMDTTGHWWVVTRPFTSQYRLIVDGKETGAYNSIKNLTFSPDGKRWACFAESVTNWFLLTNDTIISLYCTDVGEINFSGNSEILAYSYFDGDEETLILGSHRYRIYYRYGSFYLSFFGDKIAFMGVRSGKYVLNINGNETTGYDKILPMGFTYDNKFMYAAANGSAWQLFKDFNSFSDTYMNVTEVAMNREGTVAAALLRRTQNEMVAVLISDDYWEPLIGRAYDAIEGLTLHPDLPLIAYTAYDSDKRFVVQNSTEYFAGQTSGKPRFTYDGTELYFVGCAFDCFININGKQYKFLNDMEVSYDYAHKPGTSTVAYSTSSNMMLNFLDTKELRSGMMVDEIISPRYNWRTDRYEALGRINNRIYMLTCELP